jgi:uncharacterized protein
MLKLRDIQAIAAKNKVSDTQIEKDYVISWLLWGIAQVEFLRKNLIFKGGTVLKMTYFPEYRFSEDLDFTLLDSSLEDKSIQAGFDEAIRLIEEENGLELKLSPIEIHVSGSIAFYIYYVGPLGGKIESKSVKVDITRGEKMINSPVDRVVFNHYADLPSANVSLRCYPLEEVMIEKLVALMGRTQPRDLYDIWYLLEENEIALDFLQNDFVEKANHKGHDPKLFLITWNRKSKQFEQLWKHYLAHQIANLPEFDGVSRALNRHFKLLTKD